MATSPLRRWLRILWIGLQAFVVLSAGWRGLRTLWEGRHDLRGGEDITGPWAVVFGVSYLGGALIVAALALPWTQRYLQRMIAVQETKRNGP